MQVLNHRVRGAFGSTVLAFLLALSTSASAQDFGPLNPPQVIPYDGVLELHGLGVSGIVNMRFTLDDVPAVDRETGFLWQDVYEVAVTAGRFSVLLGSHETMPLPAEVFEVDELYLVVDIDVDQTEVVEWLGLTNAQRIVPVPYAYRTAESRDFVIHGEAVSEVDDGAGGIDYFYMVPRGAIVMWSGALTDISDGWALCDGSNGTPDLRDRFIVGAAPAADPGATGGAISHSHIVDPHTHAIGEHTHPMPHTHTLSHTHDVDIPPAWVGYVPNYDPEGQNGWVGSGSDTSPHAAGVWHSHEYNPPNTTSTEASSTTTSSPSVDSTDLPSDVDTDVPDDPVGTDTIDHRPPYFALAFIMRL
ncbi:MAG: tail fiber protein [Bradymonadales bacterium]|nr:tail fiber protein [Bradymonadales bacterium]